MIYHLCLWLTEEVSFFNVFKYLTFRSILAAFCALVIWLVIGRRFITLVRDFQIRQYIRTEGPASHQEKSGTPTMGGILIILAALFSTLMWVDLSEPSIWLTLFCGLSLGTLGFQDDYLKIRRRHNQGLTARQKLLAQFVIGLLTGTFLYVSRDFDTVLYMPVLKGLNLDLGLFYIPFAALVICGASNAVNLTDGLDGLAAGPVIIATLTYIVFVYCAGHSRFANYLQISYVPGAGEVTVLLAAVAGSVLGFLWHNTYPAEIFMGDVGSLSLGGFLGIAALIAKQELILIVVGGLFVLEAMSVIIQVGYFRLTGGRRVFRMAPLHHHFELKGWAEPKIIVRFWIIAIILAMIGLSTLKVR